MVHDLDVMGSNAGHVELEVCSTFVEVVLEPKVCMIKISPFPD